MIITTTDSADKLSSYNNLTDNLLRQQRGSLPHGIGLSCRRIAAITWYRKYAQETIMAWRSGCEKMVSMEIMPEKTC